MSVMHIPGHDHQRPREVSLEEIQSLMGNCQLCPFGANAYKPRVWCWKPTCSRHVYWRGSRAK